MAIIELHDLKLAVIASQHRSLRQAAQALGIRQSTLSRRLRDLEYRLGAILFERTNGGTSPTIAGLEFVQTAHRMLDEVDVALQRLRTRSSGEVGQLRIGVYASLSTGNMHATLVDYRHRFPEVDVVTIDGGRDRLLCALAANTVDIVMMTNCYPRWNDRMMSLWSERVIIAVHEHNELCRNEAVNWSNLANERMLVPQQGLGQELESLMIAKLLNVGPQRILYQEAGLDRLLSLVSAEYGSFLMLEGATGLRHNGVIYREVCDEHGPTRLNFMAYWRNSNGNPALGPFLAMLRERYPDLSIVPGLT